MAGVVSLGLGALCAALYVVARIDRNVASTAAIQAFEQSQALEESQALEGSRAPEQSQAFEQSQQIALTRAPDQGSWSPQRRAGYLESLAAGLNAPPGVLEIPALGLTVPIFAGTSELVLNRGVGWIEGTAQPGADGNLGLAGHRDGFFRSLKDLKVGDAIDVRTIARSLRYRVSEITIVAPTDVYVLDPTDEPSVTLVTCYPFYFIGNAPQRYIVRGTLEIAKGTVEQTRS